MSPTLGRSLFALLLTTGCGRIGVKLLDVSPGQAGGHHVADRSSGDLSDAGQPDAGPPANAETWSADAATALGDGSADAGDPCVTGDLCGCAASLPPEPWARWALDETSGTSAAEVSGDAPAGTLTNFTGTPWTSGEVGGGLRFDGVDDYVQIGAAGSGIQSLVFWIDASSANAITNNTGQHFPSSTGPKNGWSNAQNAYADDGKNASASTLIGSLVQDWGGFHLQQALPPGVTILGITVSVDNGSAGVLGNFGVELSWNGGTSVTSAGYSFGTLVLGGGSESAGGPDKLWGRTWSAEDLSDANFRVRGTYGGLVSGISLDYIEVQVQYSDYPNPRNILNLNGDARLEFTGSGLDIAATGWSGATLYVNGAPGAALMDGWNQVVVTGPAIDVSQLQLGNVTSESPAFSFEGVLDDVALYTEALTALQIGRLYAAPDCGP
jgi:hypothetical protein